MTFISAFRAKDGIILGADSQETYGDYKLVVDKLDPKQAGEYEIAVGGCGIGDLVDDLCEHVAEWAEGWGVLSEREMQRELRSKVRSFYVANVAAYPSRDSKRIQAIVCAKHSDSPHVFLFQLRGTVVTKVKDFSLIGWDTPIIQHFVRRLYRPGLPISQCVLLTLYLFSIVGSTVTVVGGDTRIVIARENGLHLHEHLYVDKIEENIRLFTKLIDRLVLACPDTSLTPAEFDTAITEFTNTAKAVREKYLYDFGHLLILNAKTNPNYRGDPYPLMPLGAFIQTSEGGAVTSVEIGTDAAEGANERTMAAFKEKDSKP